MRLSCTPTLDDELIRERLNRLLVSGALLHDDLARRIGRLSRAFRLYAASYPLPLWAPGLLLDNEMRGTTESLFPVAEAVAVFERLLRRGCRYAPPLSTTYLHSSPTWLDLLQKLAPHTGSADPTPLLRELALDGEKRMKFLFTLFLPQHFGGGFDRYTIQSRWIAGWLRDNGARLKGRIRILDSACGSGEGSYGVAELLEAAGYPGEGSVVHGSTLEPLELFAAAHAFFPHDERRQQGYRGRVRQLLTNPERFSMQFYLEDVAAETARESYDLVLCNGLLGGPLLHEPELLAAAFRGLASSVRAGGVLLAADHFHAGWRLRVPVSLLHEMMRVNGLTPIEVPEGVAGRNSG
jgi:hypothetical protein